MRVGLAADSHGDWAALDAWAALCRLELVVHCGDAHGTDSHGVPVLSARGKLEREYTMMNLDLRKVLSVDQWRQLRSIRGATGMGGNVMYFHKKIGPGAAPGEPGLPPVPPLPPPPPPGGGGDEPL